MRNFPMMENFYGIYTPLRDNGLHFFYFKLMTILSILIDGVPLRYSVNIMVEHCWLN